VSKSQAPAPEGQPTHGTKIRVHGVSTDNATQLVLNKLQGTIKSFLGKNQQQVALSGNQQYAATMNVPGARLHYKNNQGIETLDVEVTSEEQAGGEEQESPEYWQWAIIETTIPDMTLTSAEMAAIMNPAPKAPLIGATWEDNYVFDFDKPPLAYPGDVLGGADQLQTLTGQTDQVSSLRVDLRPYPGGVKFDLYGYIHSYIDPDNNGPANSSFLRAERNANGISSGSWTGTWHSSSGLSSGSMPSASDISGRTVGNVRNVAIQSIIEDQFPETVGLGFTSISQGALNSDNQPQGPYTDISKTARLTNGPSYTGISFTWTPGSGNDPTAASFAGLSGAAGGLFTETVDYWAPSNGGPFIKKQRGLGFMDEYANASTGFAGIAQYGAGPIDANGNYGFSCYDYTFFWLAGFDPLYVYPTRAGPIRFAVFDGKDPDGYTQLNGISGGFGSRKRWESKARGVGNRWKFKQLAVANIRSIDDPADTSRANHFGMPKLGTVIINPKKGKGGIKFIAA
jgi:hypothetical protein